MLYTTRIIQVLQISEAQTTLSSHLASKVLGSLGAKLDQSLFVGSSYWWMGLSKEGSQH